MATEIQCQSLCSEDENQFFDARCYQLIVIKKSERTHQNVTRISQPPHTRAPPRLFNWRNSITFYDAKPRSILLQISICSVSNHGPILRASNVIMLLQGSIINNKLTVELRLQIILTVLKELSHQYLILTVDLVWFWVF